MLHAANRRGRHTKGSNCTCACGAQMEAVLREGHASREGELCVQEVFSLLDVLHKWVAEGRSAASSSGSAASGG